MSVNFLMKYLSNRLTCAKLFRRKILSQKGENEMKRKLLLASICLVLCGLWGPNMSVLAEETEELEEKTAYLTDTEFKYIIEESVEDLYNIMSSSYSMNWTIKKKTRKVTSFFTKYSGSTISIGVELSNTGKAGIIGADGVMRYVEGTSLYKSFSISQTQLYLVFVQNDNNSSITSTGYYYK